MSKLHQFEHTAETFLHTLIHDSMQSEQNAKEALSKQGKSTTKHSKASSKPQITDYFTEAHSKDFEDAQILTVAVKRGHSLLSPVGRMVKETTQTKYGCGQKSSWLEDLLESERELGCLHIPFLPINSGAFWAMFDFDTRSPVLVWGEKDRQELVSFLLNQMEEYAKLCATANKATDAAMKEDATFTLDPDIVSAYSVEESVKSVMVDGKPAFVFPSSMEYQSHANLNKYIRSFAFQPSESKAFSQAQSSNDKSHPALATKQGTITTTLLHPPLVIFPPAPTLSHPRLVFTSLLSHVKEEYAPVLFLVHQHSVENVAQLLASDERRKAEGSKTTTGSAEQPHALSAEQLEATPTTQHIDTMRGIDDCSQFARSLFAVSNPLLLAEELMKRIECLGRVFGYLEQGIAESFDIQNTKTSSLSFATLPNLESSLATMHSSQSLQYDFQSVSLIHTIQRTAAGRESSEQFAEHAEFELLVIDCCVKICTTSFALIYTLIHPSKARLLSFKDKNGLALVFSFFNVTPFLSTLYPISWTVQPNDSLLARSAPRQKTQSPVPLVSISRIESAMSHPISFPKAHRVIVSLGSLIPLFASNQMVTLSLGPRSFLYQNQISRFNRSATTNDNFDVLNHLFKVFLLDMSPLILASLPFAPTKATLARIAKLYTSAFSPDAREAVKMEMSVLIKRMSQYAEKRHACEEKWNELASMHSQDRYSRQSGCAVCTAMIQLGKEESADFEATRASLYLHLNTAIKLKQRPPNSFCNMQSAVGRWNVIKTSADADFDETEFRDERVSSFILSSHDDKLDLHGNPITHAKEETTDDATDEELDTPSPSSAMDDHKSEPSLHIISHCLLAPSPVARSAVFVHFTLSALRFGVTAEHCAFLKFLVVVENAWASAATKAELPPTALLISDHHSIPLTAFIEYFNAAFFPSTSSFALDSFAVSQRLWTPQAVSTLNATTDLLLDSFFVKWEANPFSTFIHTTPPVLLDTVCINTRESFLSLLKQIREMPLIPLFTPLHSPLTIPHPPLCIVDYSPSLAADVFVSPSFSLTSVQSLFTSLFEDSWQNGTVPSPLRPSADFSVFKSLALALCGTVA
ncbi:hypothetical protein BLNAU_15169 [Blattamonas nauphoetae]|uniref:Uncharacterized protein n=1 Tax=Blattamonas nauphoetae TaxID=2049346 RepID=A0ABQ9XBG5_9EUKA|nr:hypothetical protein BLNAU_15169 [Blattamonas nauphoetae]